MVWKINLGKIRVDAPGEEDSVTVEAEMEKY